MALGALIGRIFGTEKAVNTAVDGVVNAFDKLVYTKEEKADDARKDTSEARAIILDWIATSKGQNIARRVLAFMVAFTWLGMFLGAFVVGVASIWSESNADEIQATSQLIGSYADNMTGAMMLILGFYFAAPHLDKIIGPALERFGRPK